MTKHPVGHELPEQLLTLKDASKLLGIQCWKLSRAAKAGVFPTYALFNSRKLVRISEILAAIDASAKEDWS